jgi:hypothetical protein
MPQMEQELLTLSVAHEYVFCFLLCFCLFVCLVFFPISEVRVVQVTKLHVFTFLVPFCDFRHDFLVKTTFVRLDSDFFFWASCFIYVIVIYLRILANRIGGVMVSVLASSAVDRWFEPRSGQNKDYQIGICCFSAKHATLRRKSIDWLARNQINVSEWSDMSTRGLLFQCASAMKKNQIQHVGIEQSGPHHHLIENQLVLAMI